MLHSGRPIHTARCSVGPLPARPRAAKLQRLAKIVKINRWLAVPLAGNQPTAKKRRLRFVAVTLGTAALLLLAWRMIPAFPAVPNSGWTLLLMILSYGLLATVLSIWHSVSRLKKATSMEIVSKTEAVVEESDDRPQWMITTMDVAAAAYLGGLIAALVQRV